MFNPAKHVSARETPQSEPIFNKPMVPNSAGGYSFEVDDWTRLDRFLILGSEGGTYYVSENKLTVDNAACVQHCLDADPVRTINRIIEISDSGRAPKNDSAIFALAMAFAHKNTTNLSDALAKVCRIGTHLFQFAEMVQSLRGWGRSLRKAVAHWYTEKEPASLAYQVVKYQQRNGWSHRDLLRLAHPKAEGMSDHILAWVTGKVKNPHDSFGGADIIVAFEKAKKATINRDICRLIRDYNLPRECIPTHFLVFSEVWEALLENMPLTAMIRNLAIMTRVGLIAPLSDAAGKVVSVLADKAKIKKSRIHPMAVLLALKTYASGHGDKGKNIWNPVPQVMDALDGAFYTAFGNVEITGKRWMLGIDVSGSMSSDIAGTSLSCCEAATAMALVTAHTETFHYLHAFADRFRTLPITANSRLHEALAYTRSQNFGGTDCSLPMIYALENHIPVDVFVVLTDSETWAGNIQPCQALVKYREKMGRPAKLIVVGMTSTGFTIADPSDGGMLDVAGFDTSVPNVMADFAKN